MTWPKIIICPPYRNSRPSQTRGGPPPSHLRPYVFVHNSLPGLLPRRGCAREPPHEEVGDLLLGRAEDLPLAPRSRAGGSRRFRRVARVATRRHRVRRAPAAVSRPRPPASSDARRHRELGVTRVVELADVEAGRGIAPQEAAERLPEAPELRRCPGMLPRQQLSAPPEQLRGHLHATLA